MTDQPGAVDVSPENNAGAIVINGAALDALPDDPDELQTDLTALAGPSAGPNGGQFYIDGFTAGQLPPKSSIREIRINRIRFRRNTTKSATAESRFSPSPARTNGTGEFSVNAQRFRVQLRESRFLRAGCSATSEYPPYYSVQYTRKHRRPAKQESVVLFHRRHSGHQRSLHRQCADCGHHVAGFSDCAIQRCGANPRTRDNLGPRLDYQLIPTNTLSVRYQYYRDDFKKRRNKRVFSSYARPLNISTTEHTLQMSDTQTFGPKIVNETRFQYLHQTSSQIPQNTATTLLVQGAFVGGGSNDGTILDTSNHYEFQNYTSISHGTHSSSSARGSGASPTRTSRQPALTVSTSSLPSRLIKLPWPPVRKTHHNFC